jgi:hypothetical protein
LYFVCVSIDPSSKSTTQSSKYKAQGSALVVLCNLRNLRITTVDFADQASRLLPLTFALIMMLDVQVQNNLLTIPIEVRAGRWGSDARGEDESHSNSS